jgi:hypothetical protein
MRTVADTPENDAGENYEVKELSPRELTETDLAVCVAVIKQGDAVDWESAARELPRATALAIVYKGVQILGVGAIKRERRNYAASVSKNSGVEAVLQFRKLVIRLLAVFRCFVAVTRAQTTLTLTFARNYSGWSKHPSRFLREMDVLQLVSPTG